MLLKVCGLNNVANISRLLPLRPDFIGFIFHPGSRRYAGDNDELAAFAQNITGVKKTGVFVAATEETIKERIYEFSLDIVQLHGGQSPAFCESIRKHKPVIKVFSVDEHFDAADTTDFNDVCDYLLFDTATPKHGGSGVSFNWDVLSNAAIEKPFFLSGGIGQDNALQAINFAHPSFMGIDVNSRYESSPGIKNIDLIKTLLHEIHS